MAGMRTNQCRSAEPGTGVTCELDKGHDISRQTQHRCVVHADGVTSLRYWGDEAFLSVSFNRTRQVAT